MASAPVPQWRNSATIPRKPIPSSPSGLNKFGPIVHVLETTKAKTGNPMDTHGIDLSSLGGSTHYSADPISRRDSLDNGVAANGAFHSDQRHDARAALLHNAQDPAFGRDSPSLSEPQQPQPLPYSAANYMEPPNARRGWLRAPKWDLSYHMYLWLLLGIVCAVGHHVFYHSLDGQAAEDQVRMLRYGTILAFAAKASLGAAVILAFQQRVWTSVSSRFMSVATLDSLFAATENFVALFNRDLLKSAKAAAALAFFVWLSPLVVILTANTLLVEPRTIMQNTTCPGVRSLNFAKEGTHDWRKPVKIDGLYEMPLSIWNSTKPSNEDPPGWFDYYTGPSPNFQQAATLGAFLQEVVPRKNASIEVCGKGWNCTFEVDFTAPGYKCREQAKGIGSKPANLTQESGEAKPPFGTNILLPEGSFAYYAFTSGGEYSTTQMKNVGIGGIPNTDPPHPEHMGALRTEPVIWIGHVVPADDEHPASSKEGVPKYIPRIFACEHYETEYTAVFNYTDTTQSAYMKKRKFLTPIINTTYIHGLDADDGTADNVTAIPKENYVLPQDVERYRRIASYHSLGFMLRKFLNGTVQIDKKLVNPMANTEAIQTKLLDPRNNYFPYANLMDMVQEFYEDLILTIFSTPQFLPVVWASHPNEVTGQLVQGGGPNNHSAYDYECQRSRMANVYSYHARDLWIVYAIAISMAISAVVTGFLAKRENGGMRNTRFSSIVAATRGLALEKINWEGSDRGHVSEHLKELKLGYGVMKQPGDGAFDIDGRYPRAGTAWSPKEFKYGFGLQDDIDLKRNHSGSLSHK
ncbi:hypothetical protein CCHL11_01315 [Colletotrichum chlorophyti]|uniref:Formylmethionine deformylase-like protein n=1 Tax=Colletotrichum chlorophyti TaxID=708187 RepID=A0A1Q8RYS2_9PEZI|nr:hypothetical protein CCHL11_01315 [Colletotrichum chlorophyti]